jgi:uncharacterized membrane protein
MDVTTIAILVVEIVGFAGAGFVIYRMKQQIGALDGTVRAQAEALRTIAEVNKIALETAKAFDPKKYTEALNAYQDLIERKAGALVDDARRAFEREHKEAREQAEESIREFNMMMRAAFELLAYVAPIKRREAVNGSATMTKQMKEWFLSLADVAPDLSKSEPTLREILGTPFAGTPLPLAESVKLPIDPKRGGMDVRGP